MDNPARKKDIDAIHKQVPVDYYEQGIKNNLLQKYWHLRKLKTIKNFLNNTNNPSHRLLDLGCHSGFLINQLKVYMPPQTHAIDISKTAIDYAQKKYPTIRFIVHDLENGIPYPDNHFDTITTFDVLEHIPNPDKVSSEIRRVLKKDGHLIMGIPNENILFKSVWYLWTKSKGKVWDDVHLNDFDDQLLDKVFDSQGFKKLLDKKIHFNMWRIVKYQLKDKYGG